MILADSSVWIDHFVGKVTPATLALRQLLDGDSLVVGDLILMEVVQGARSDAQAESIRAAMLRCEYLEMVTPGLALAAAQNYRLLRSRSFTVRSSIDVLIATYCIGSRTELLCNDRDFEPFARHLGLKLVLPTPPV